MRVTTEMRLVGRTGVEMEALVAAAIAALTVYDMCKAVDRGIEVTGVRLSKSGAARAATGGATGKSRDGGGRTGERWSR